MLGNDQTAIRAGAETYLAEDHQVAERLFGKIIGGRYPFTPEEGK